MGGGATELKREDESGFERWTTTFTGKSVPSPATAPSGGCFAVTNDAEASSSVGDVVWTGGLAFEAMDDLKVESSSWICL